jgi:hypothetical protein
MNRPTPEDLAELSRLYNERRRLRNLRTYETEQLLAPLNKLYADARKQVDDKFNPLEDVVFQRIRELKQKFRMKIEVTGRWPWPRL